MSFNINYFNSLDALTTNLHFVRLGSLKIYFADQSQ